MIKFILILLSIQLVLCSNPDKKGKVLILSDNPAIYLSHSIFFDQIRNLGYQIEYKNFITLSFNLLQYGEYNYDHIILFASQEEEIKGLKLKDIYAFFDHGHNVIVLGSSDQSKYFRQLINGFGIDMQEPGTIIYDHFNNIHTSNPNIVTTTNYKSGTPFIDKSVNKPILYRGSGLQITPYETQQVYQIVSGSVTSYSSHPLVEGMENNNDDDDFQQANGIEIQFVSGMQGRNNARVIVTGSIDIFSNEFMSQEGYGNYQLSNSLIKWTFQQSGVIRVGDIEHRNYNTSELKPQNYKISDYIYFSCDIWEWDSQNNKWIGFRQPDLNDVLVEFIMLDPYYRLPLVQNQQISQKYEVDFRIPDRQGIFQFKINYQRPGYSFLNTVEKVIVRPYKHNEYERYLQQAYPYYLSTFGTIFGFLVFVLYYLTNRSEKKNISSN